MNKPKNKPAQNQELLKFREDMEQMRLQVVELELKARYWKAQYEIRHYSLQYDKIQPEYEVYLQKEVEARKEAMEKLRQQIEATKGLEIKDDQGNSVNVNEAIPQEQEAE